MGLTDDKTLFRVYEPRECGEDGYPEVWHSGILIGDDGPFVLPADVRDRPSQDSIGVKHLVRSEAGDRCVRCGHPYVAGVSGRVEGDMSPEGAEMLAAVGASQEVLDLAFTQMVEDGEVPTADPEKARRTHWSPCDDRCNHGGHCRARIPGRPWEVRLDAQAIDAAMVLDQRGEVEAAWRILTVHHLNEVKADLRWWNLAALCQRCHLTIQRKVTMERVWPWEHSEWFKPHAAGWYAYAYLGEGLSRTETEARLEDLLALERMA